MVQHTGILIQWPVTMEVVYDLSNGAIFSELQRPLPPVSRSRHSLTLNIINRTTYRHRVIEILIIGT